MHIFNFTNVNTYLFLSFYFFIKMVIRHSNNSFDVFPIKIYFNTKERKNVLSEIYFQYFNIFEQNDPSWSSLYLHKIESLFSSVLSFSFIFVIIFNITNYTFFILFSKTVIRWRESSTGMSHLKESILQLAE